MSTGNKLARLVPKTTIAVGKELAPGRAVWALVFDNLVELKSGMSRPKTAAASRDGFRIGSSFSRCWRMWKKFQRYGAEARGRKGGIKEVCAHA